MRKNFLVLISIAFMFFTLLTVWVNLIASFALGIVSLLFSLALSTHIIIQKHKETENARPKILKEVGMMVLTLTIVLFLGGIAAMLANYQAGLRWGEVAGLLSAIGASFAVGYLVRKGMMRFVR